MDSPRLILWDSISLKLTNFWATLLLFLTEMVILIYRLTSGCLDSNGHVSCNVVNSANGINRFVRKTHRSYRSFSEEVPTKNVGRDMLDAVVG